MLFTEDSHHAIMWIQLSFLTDFVLRWLWAKAHSHTLFQFILIIKGAMSLLFIAIYTNSVFVCLSHWQANRAREMQHSVLLFISRGEDINCSFCTCKWPQYIKIPRLSSVLSIRLYYLTDWYSETFTWHFLHSSFARTSGSARQRQGTGNTSLGL